MYLLKIPPNLIYVATLPCETLTSENERQSQINAVIKDKLQGGLVQELHMSGVVGFSITKLRMLYC